jgi:GT2 family glycosyltransferase
LQEIEAGGSAFLIARRVLETVDVPQFADGFDDWGIMIVSEDINFCRKARAAGFKIWSAYSHPCGHIKEVDLVDLHNEVKEWN